MPVFELEATWTMIATFKVEAATLAEAIEKAQNESAMPDGTYLNDSFEVTQAPPQLDFQARQTYKLERVELSSEYYCNERDSTGNNRLVSIPGDKGDILADEALSTDFGTVELVNVELFSTLMLSESEVLEVIEEIVSCAYKSIGEETFNQTRRK